MTDLARIAAALEGLRAEVAGLRADMRERDVKPQKVKKPRRAITPAEQAQVNRAIDARLTRMGAGRR